MTTTLLNYKKKLKGFLHKKTAEHVPVTVQPPDYNIPEILEINCRQSELTGKRFNLLVPALSLRFTFGGINTALDFFAKLTAGASNIRIIITDEVTSDLQGLSGNADWKLLSNSDIDENGKVIICFGDRYGKNIPVRENDYFVATAWWTAFNGILIQEWQQTQWNKPVNPLIYLVQDFEPAFYKWSSRYSLALGTYLEPNIIPVINTKLLSDFISLNNIKFKNFFVFEPNLNNRLAATLPSKTNSIRKKQILIYGRPSVERNAFEILIKGLELWSWWHPHAKDWTVISLGESYEPIQLGNNMVINVRGKVTLEEYSNLLLSSAVGLSLMVSPHPSYPPLEMAAFDMAVVTNSFFNKDLSKIHENILSLDNPNPENIAKALMNLCDAFEQNPEIFRGKNFADNYFVNNNEPFDFIQELHKLLNN